MFDWVLNAHRHNYCCKGLSLSLSLFQYYTSLIISFQELIEEVEPYIKNKDTVMRKAIIVDERLSLTLRFLATGHSFSDLEAGFKIHRTAVSGIVIKVCEAIYDCLKEEYLKIPQTN